MDSSYYRPSFPSSALLLSCCQLFIYSFLGGGGVREVTLRDIEDQK